uniref:DUF3707 domain-containing protein n=1 Tax=Heterorhabditis bacteriophora TaxID=37862 RepID=A0A1I7WM19_HETBA
MSLSNTVKSLLWKPMPSLWSQMSWHITRIRRHWYVCNYMILYRTVCAIVILVTSINFHCLSYFSRNIFSTNYTESRSIHCVRVPDSDYSTKCTVTAGSDVTRPGDRCFVDFEPALLNIRSMCPTFCQYADSFEVVHKKPSNNHVCLKFVNYGLERYVLRYFNCKNINSLLLFIDVDLYFHH